MELRALHYFSIFLIYFQQDEQQSNKDSVFSHWLLYIYNIVCSHQSPSTMSTYSEAEIPKKPSLRKNLHGIQEQSRNYQVQALTKHDGGDGQPLLALDSGMPYILEFLSCKLHIVMVVFYLQDRYLGSSSQFGK